MSGDDPLTLAYSQGLRYIAMHTGVPREFEAPRVIEQALILQALATCQRSTASTQAATLTADWLADALRAPNLPFAATFAALAALASWDPERIDGHSLGRATQSLLAAELHVGGPYHVIRPDSRVSMPDIGVNASIAHFVQLVSRQLPRLQAYMAAAIGRRDLSSTTYSPAATLWRLSLAYQGALDQQLTVLLRYWGERVDHYALEACFVAAALRQRSIDLPAALRQRLLEPPRSRLQAALVLAASRPIDTNGPRNFPPAPLKAVDYPYAQARATFARQFSPTLHKGIDAILTRIQAADRTNEIVLLPHWVTGSLLQAPALPANTLSQLGIANLYNWIAFTLYDDFYDGSGTPRLLPVANAALHHALRTFETALPGMADFQRAIHQAFDELDNANAWEIVTSHMPITEGSIMLTSLPDFGDRMRLAERSFTHMLPMLGIVAAAGHPLESPAAQALRQAGQHYLIARQLNDDMHDWEEDILAGNITYVVGQALQEIGLSSGTYPLQDLRLAVQKQFWKHTIIAVCDTVAEHITQGRQAAQRSQLLLPHSAFDQLFDNLARILARTRREHAKAMSFLETYQAPIRPAGDVEESTTAKKS